MNKILKKNIAKYRTDIEKGLNDLFDNYEISELSELGQESWEILKELSQRPAKRIRGSLTIYTYELFGGRNKEEIIKAAAVVELIQNYLLIVDDVMDRSASRRGGKTVHKLYSDKLEKLVDDETFREHLSNMMAVNLGLVTAHVALEELAKLNKDPKINIQAFEVLNRNIFITSNGQLDDLISGVTPQTHDSIIDTIEKKTSYYTFVNPMQLGAVLAGVNGKKLKLIEEFGRPAGIAFQLQDDLLGLFGNPKVSGKSDHDDLREGKFTLLVQVALERANQKQAKVIKAALGNPDITDQQIEEVRKLLRDLEVDIFVKQTALQYATKAKKVLEKPGWETTDLGFLRELMDYIVKRSR